LKVGTCLVVLPEAKKVVFDAVQCIIADIVVEKSPILRRRFCY
jgi:hypothetical protein